MTGRNLAFGVDFSGVNTSPIHDLNKAMDDTVKKAGESGKGFKGMADSLDEMGKKAQSAGKTMMKGVTLPLVGIGTAAIKTVSTFDDSMSQVGAIAGNLTDNEFTGLRDMAKDLGATTAHSASSAADGMSTLAAAGYDFNKIQAATPQVLSLASAGMLELDDAAGILTGTLAMFSMDATEKNFQRVSDVTAQAASSAKTSVEEIGSAMNMAGGAAGSMGMDIEQTNAVLGVFANQNIVGGRAGTVFTAMQSDLASAAEDGRIAIADQAVAVYDSEGAWRDMGSILADVESATEGMTNAQRDKILMDTFGVQSMKGVNAMLTEGSENYKDLEDAMYGSEGAAARMAEEMENNIGGAFRSLSSATEGFMIEIGDVLKGPVHDVADFVANLAGKFGELSEPTKKTIVLVAGIAAAIGPVLFAGGKLMSGVKLVGAAFGAIFSPIGLLVGGLALLAGGLVYLWKTNDDFKEGVVEAWSIIQDKMGSALEFIMNLWETHGESIMSKVAEVFDWIGEKVMLGVSWLIEFWQEHGESIVSGVTSTFTRIWGVISGILEIVMEVVSSALSWISGFWQQHGDTIMSATEIAWGVISGVIDGAMSVIQGIIDVVLGVIQGDWDRVWTGIQGIFEGVMTALGAAWDGAKAIIGVVIEGTLNAITDGFHSAIEGAKNAWDGLKTFMKNPIKGTVSAAKKGAGWLGSKISGSHASGAYNIPYDGYVGELHKGEMVLTASASDQYRAMGGTENSIPQGRPSDRLTGMVSSPISNVAHNVYNKVKDVINNKTSSLNEYKESLNTATTNNDVDKQRITNVTNNRLENPAPRVDSKSKGDTITFEPVIKITIEGDTTEDNTRELERMMRKVFKREQEAFFSKLNLQT